MPRPKVYEGRLTINLTAELVARMERVRALRADRLGVPPPAADIYREALAEGLVLLLAKSPPEAPSTT
jgi:hypothetical protein